MRHDRDDNDGQSYSKICWYLTYCFGGGGGGQCVDPRDVCGNCAGSVNTRQDVFH